MRKGLAAVLLVCVLAGLGLYFLSHRSPSAGTASAVPGAEPAPSSAAPAGAQKSSVKTNQAATGQVAGAELRTTSAAESPVTPPGGVSGPLLFGGAQSTPVKIAPETVLENTRSAIRNYGSMFGGNPVGTNPEITSALNGENPKEVKFLDPEKGMRINSQGELVDSWGTPFFFHQLSGTEMEIRSAGPDKKMWTADDLVMQ